jgi:uncharacterized protein YciI
MHYMLTYELSEDYMKRRTEFRDAHLGMAWAARERGDLFIAGALQDPVDTAILVFTGESGAAAEEFARNDPYVKNGLVKSWTVRPWMTVVGEHAASPVRPAAK